MTETWIHTPIWHCWTIGHPNCHVNIFCEDWELYLRLVDAIDKELKE